jgi:hypothetical protein
MILREAYQKSTHFHNVPNYFLITRHLMMQDNYIAEYWLSNSEAVNLSANTTVAEEGNNLSHSYRSLKTYFIL